MTLPILTADDYALTDGVAHSIETLAYERRLSATSVMTTMPEWPAAAARLVPFRDRLSIGLHLNLTLGAPLGPMRHLAPAGVFPALAPLLRAALLSHLSHDEVRGEIACQLDSFERHLGFMPDHVDGHQHVQVLPTIRSALLAELDARYPDRRPLVRNPSTAVSGASGRGRAGAKGLLVALLAVGFRRHLRSGAVPTNARFAGYSTFDTTRPYAAEIATELACATLPENGLSIVMCHPGYADATLAALDPVVERRQQEHDALMQLDHLPEKIWHARRTPDGPPIDWVAEAAS